MNVSKNFSLAWPLALNALLVQSMVMVDLLLVAPLGETAVAALGIATTLTAFLIGIQFALASGTQLILARMVGKQQQQQQQFFIGLAINLCTSLVFSGLLFFVGPVILQGLSLAPEITAFAQQYLNVMVWVFFVSAVSQVIIVLFNAQGNTRIPLLGLVLEIPVNMLVSYGCIYGIGFLPEFGVQGAALGSLAAVSARCGYLILKLRQHMPEIQLLHWPTLTKPQFKQHLNESSPIAANYVTLSFGMMVFQLLFSKLPINEYAAVVLVMPWLRMGGQVSTAWAQATSIHISQLIGQDLKTQTVAFVEKIMPITLSVGIVLGLLYVGFGYSASFIYPSQHPETLAVIIQLVPLYMALTVFRTINTSCGQALRAFGDSGFVLKVHASTQWLAALPLCALFLYLNVPVFWVFAMLLLEEVLKTVPFGRRLKLTLAKASAEH